MPVYESSESDAVPLDRPQTTVILAVSVDGKIADRNFHGKLGSATDYAHLERQVAAADGVLVGAGTLRSEQAGVRVVTPALLQARQTQGKSPQPVHIVCTRSGQLPRDLKFFQQPLPRWLLTTPTGAQHWTPMPEEFAQILSYADEQGSMDWLRALAHLKTLGINQLAVIGGGEIVAALLAADLIDELHLTICPLIVGGQASRGAVGGAGFLMPDVPRLDLLEVRQVEQELFLHYRVRR